MRPKNSRLANVLLLVLAFLIGIEMISLTLCRPKYRGLSGLYYDNQNWDGKPYLASIDDAISSDTLKARREQLPQNRYSVQWEGYIDIPETAIYTFSNGSDDGSWILIDDSLVVDNGGEHSLKEKSGRIHLFKGLHTIKIRYFQAGGRVALHVWWQKDHAPQIPLTSEFLLPLQAYFKLTTFTFQELKKAKIPDAVLAQLEGLKNKEFTTTYELLELVKRQIGEEQTLQYKDTILRYAPSQTNTASIWIYQTARAVLPFLIAVWGVTIVGFGSIEVAALSRSKKLHFSRYSRLFPLIKLPVVNTFRRLCIEPLVFTGQQLRKPQVRLWLFIVMYTLVIYLTLSYARDFSTFMMSRYGEDIFSRITVYVLLVAGAGFLLYLFVSRSHFVVRLLCFIVILGIYAYILSPAVRDAVHAVTQYIGYTGEFFDSLDIYPIYPGEKVHFLEYGLLGLLLCRVLRYHLKDRTAYLLVIVMVYIVGLIDEGIQWALPNRVGEYRDIWLNFMSGGLAVLAVWLVIRPRIFQKPFQWSSLRPVLYTLACTMIITGVFLKFVHGFGASSFMPDTGTQFVSAFPEQQLLQLDKILLQRSRGEFAEDLPAQTRQTYRDEAQRHQYFRDLYYRNKRMFESYCEQEILNTYFRAYLWQKSLKPFEYEPDRFVIKTDPNKHIFYVSPGQELSITRFQEQSMWMFIGIVASFCCLVAASLPIAPEKQSQYGKNGVPTKPQQRFELAVLRPIFGGIFVLSLIISMVLIRAALQKPELQHTNLLILTIDSAQPEYLGAYGYYKNTTPFFDALASEGVLFSNMIVPTSWTIPSLASMLTGVSPNVHGIDARGKLMDPAIPTLFEVMEQHGYVIGDTSYTLTEPSINSVFKKSEISPEVALSEGRSEESYFLSWMEKHKEQPFFAWVHFHTTHLPYRASPPYNQLFLEDINQGVLNDEQIKYVLSQLVIRKGQVEFDPQRHAAVIRAFYVQTLRQQDAKIGKVIQKLDELGLRENTLIVITADHGEELLEHGFVGHASTSWDATVYDDLIQVPLLIYYPKAIPQGKRIDTQVRMIDIMPTILDILDIPFSTQIQGKSFLSAIQGPADFQETAYAETTPCGYTCPKRLENNRLRAVRTNEWKLIAQYNYDTGETHYALYHLKDDPRETRNVITDYPDIAAQFKQELQHWMDAPAQFDYQYKKTEGPHYLDVDVEVRPVILFPKIGTVISPETHNQRVLLQWIGSKDMEYIIEYEVGTGEYYMSGQLEVVGNEQWFGPFPEDIWQALPLYNPWKFRIIPKPYPQYPSDWITFEMQSK